MSLELKIEALTAAVEANTTAIKECLAQTGARSEPAGAAETAPKKTETPPKKTPPKDKKPAESEPSGDAEGAKAVKEIVTLLTARFAKGVGTAAENRDLAAKVKDIFKQYGAEKAGDIPEESGVEALALVQAALSGDSGEDAGDSLI